MGCASSLEVQTDSSCLCRASPRLTSPLVTLSANDPNWTLPWPGGRWGMRDDEMLRDLPEKERPLKNASLYLVSNSSFTP